ncbi:hypothetical protein HYPSUDRAFT_38482 [Hypholoma sublateritium FD-334 SS-4]|uniref:F-box domain-containing protein n=1 Tax=Hypholoma sublateritium (strain FD-334 SS-4) TaxID=945553 RepID=A0A0D2MLR9_HYPSF|nr:hypothetical protein HYPSUDRAFT_38482 [Hypholoma sublateritium FD-334 SS-4]
MSALPNDSPIRCLNFDILWCIIDMNANMFDDNTAALKTTLTTSRVCRDWRSFMLRTPSIWAHLIDVDYLYRCTIEGRRELFRRSGTALLWIQTHTPNSHPLCVPPRYLNCVLDVLCEYRERIQRLDATIVVRQARRWKPLYLPMPYLESFSVTLVENSRASEVQDIRRLLPFSVLFGGSAPMLQELCYRSGRANLTAPWLRQLRSMVLWALLTVSETLGVLMLTNNLVKLQISNTYTNDMTAKLPLATLPKLAYLELSLHFDLISGAVLLDHMSIPPACSLRFSMEFLHHEYITNKSTLGSVIQAISTCAQRHFTHHVPQALGLVFEAFHSMDLTTSYSDERRCNEQSFVFSMNLASNQVFPAHALPILLSKFTLPHFSEVTEMVIVIAGKNRPVPELAAFIARLPSVNIIHTDAWSLRHVARAQAALERAHTGPQTAFPALKTLRIAFSGLEPFTTFDSAPDPISKFVMPRIARGHAIATVDFTENTLDVLPDVEFIRKAHGLKVLWRKSGVAEILEHICGTGMPKNIASIREVSAT